MAQEQLLKTVRPIVALVIAIWAVEVINQITGHRVNHWLGLEPRSLSGLIGIPAMPFLHGGIRHAAANTLPLIFLGAIGLVVAPRRFAIASVVIVFASGLAVWLLARNAIHVGASGLIFGWFGFIVALGALERSGRTVIGALVVIIFYGGMVWGVLPRTGTPISWEAHLFGALAGAGAAYLLQKRRINA